MSLVELDQRNVRTTRVRKFATAINGFPFSSKLFSSEGDFPLVRIRDILSASFETFIPKDSCPTEAVIRDDDIVIGMDGDFNSRLWDRGEAALNQRVCALRSNSVGDIRYVNYAIPQALKQINDVTFSTTVKHLSASQILDIELPDHPLETQRAIADYLDRETGEIDSMLAELDALVALLEERRREVIQDLTGVTGGYKMAKLAVCAQVILGKTLQPKQLSDEEELVPYVRAGNIQPNGVFDWETKYMWMTPAEQQTLEPCAGDVLVVEGGAGYGRSLFLDKTLEGWAFQNHVLRIRPTADWDGQFIDYVIRAHLAGGLIERMSVGATIPGLSSEKARSLPIPAFPLTEQQRRADAITTHLAGTREMLSDVAELKSLLLERRSALITDVVTGRKQVV